MSVDEIFEDAKANLQSVMAEFIEAAKMVVFDNDSIRTEIEEILDEELKEG